MFCTYCNKTRVENEAPCPYCGAPSPLKERSPVREWDSSAYPARPQTGPLSSSEDGLLSGRYARFSDPVTPPTWTMPVPLQEQETSKQQAQLPVPYQNAMLPQQIQSFTNLQAVPTQNQAQMLPALPDETHGAIYVPPMYTKPRAIIPRYRAISGLLSIIIVTMLMCMGTVYYAKATGTLDTLGRTVGVKLPKSLRPTPTLQLLDPPGEVDKGPAFSIIDSATTTSSIDPITHTPKLTERVFAANHLFYVTYSVQHPPQTGLVVVKWYTNGALYRVAQSKPVERGTTVNGDSEMIYVEQAEGMVELYWNDQLAQRLYFVVR